MKFNYFLINPFKNGCLKRPVNWILFITLAFHCRLVYLQKKLGCRQFQQFTKKGILLINDPESFIKELKVLSLFFYKGAKSSIDERAAAAMLADQMDKKLGGIATQVCG